MAAAIYGIDLTDVVRTVVVPIFETLVPILATWLAVKIGKRLNIPLNDNARDIISHVADNAVKAAANVALSHPEVITTHDQKVAFAANYIATNAVDAVKRLKLSPEAIANIVHARLLPPLGTGVLPARDPATGEVR